MNKKLLAAFSQEGVTFEKNRGYGVVRGFETNVIFSNINPIVMMFSCYASDEQKRNVLQSLASEKIKFTQFSFGKFGLAMAINDWTAGSLAKRLSAVLEKVCGTLTSCGALGIGYCPVCGNALDFENCKKCDIEGMSVSIDNECVDNINGLIDEENKAIDEAPNNYLRGFAGAFVGSLVGVALAVLLYIVGFVSALSAFVAFFVGELLYRKFGGKPNSIMIVILTSTVFIMMIAAVVGTYLVAVAIEAGKNGISASDGIRICFQDEEFVRNFVTAVVLTVVFTVLGCAYEIYMLWKRIKRQKNI